MVTRSRKHARAGEPKTPGAGPSLLSPGMNAKVDSFFEPRNKAARVSSGGRPAPASKDSLRQLRIKGPSGPKPPLTGYLGALPVEVRRGGGPPGPARPPARRNRRQPSPRPRQIAC